MPPFEIPPIPKAPRDENAARVDGPHAPARRQHLVQALVHLAKALGRPVAAAAFDAVLPHAAPDVTIEVSADLDAAIKVFQAEGFSCYFGGRDLAQLRTVPLPALIFLPDGGMRVLEAREIGAAFAQMPEAVAVAEDGPEIWQAFNPETGESETFLPASVTGRFHVLVVREPLTPALGATSAQDDLAQRKRRWLLQALSEHRWAYVQVVLAALISNILVLTTSLFTMVVYDRILPSGAVETLWALASGVALALVFDFVLRSLRAAFIDHAGGRADVVMGTQLFDRLTDLKMSARKSSAGATAAAMREFEVLRDFFTSSTLMLLVDLPFVFLFLGVIYLIGGVLVLVPLAALGLVIAICLLALPRLNRLAEAQLGEGKEKHAVLVETLQGLETIKAVGAVPFMRARWVAALARQARLGVKSRALMQYVTHATATIQQIVQLGLVVWGALLVIGGTISAGVLIATVILSGRVMGPLAQLTHILARAQQARAGWRSLDVIMAGEVERAPHHAVLSRPTLQGALRFENVEFTYRDAPYPALDGVSFSIAAGEKVAILGRVGSGKSTVLRLIMGLQQAQRGRIFLDGTELGQIDPLHLRRNMGAVLQEGWMVSGSLRDNITLGRPDASDAQILAAAKLAGVDEFAALHPAGYGRHLGEGGRELSGGQRQAVALARAFLAQAPLLLLDEPSAAMDVETEAALIQRMRHAPLAMGRSLILVTHRTSLLALVDRVIVLDRGQVVADGPVSMLTRRANVGGGAQPFEARS